MSNTPGRGPDETGHMRLGAVIDAPYGLGAYRYDRPHPSRTGWLMMTALAQDGRPLFSTKKDPDEIIDWWLRGGKLYDTAQAYADAQSRRRRVYGRR